MYAHAWHSQWLVACRRLEGVLTSCSSCGFVDMLITTCIWTSGRGPMWAHVGRDHVIMWLRLPHWAGSQLCHNQAVPPQKKNTRAIARWVLPYQPSGRKQSQLAFADWIVRCPTGQVMTNGTEAMPGKGRFGVSGAAQCSRTSSGGPEGRRAVCAGTRHGPAPDACI